MDKIYDEYYEKIYHWSIRKTRHKEDAEDLTNNVFLAIFEYFNKDIEVEKVENLIWKIAYNLWCTKAKNYMKEKENTFYDEHNELSYDIPMLDKIVYKEIIHNLNNIGLTDKEKSAFEMYYVHDLSIKDISIRLNTKVNNIKYYLYSARNKVKERYYD